MDQEITKNVIVVIPAYKVAQHVCEVVRSSLSHARKVIVVDDACPDASGQVVEKEFLKHPDVVVVFRAENGGVGAATISGFKVAIDLGGEIVVKVDGDGQMNPDLIPLLIEPIASGRADYTKGNRFFRVESLKSMPPVRLFGNAVLSLWSKLAHGYWDIMDPTNGFIAIHVSVLASLPLDKVETRYFFENDMLYRLGVLRAVVRDMPMDAKYGDEQSNLSIPQVLFEFPPKYFSRVCRRVFYSYFLRNFSACSLELVLGGLLSTFGLVFGVVRWIQNGEAGTVASAGTVMLAGLSVLVGINLLIAALNFDMTNVPRDPLHKVLPKPRTKEI